LKLSLVCYYCRQGAEGVCRLASVQWKLPLLVRKREGLPELLLEHDLP
jgi:hypothetical protein